MRSRSITYDWDGEGLGPQVGDVLRSSKSDYLVVGSRQVRSRVHPSRWALKVLKVDASAHVMEDGARTFTLQWHRRDRKS